MRIVNMTPDKSVVKEHICKHCGITLEYVPADIKSKRITDYTGSLESVKYITCPMCKFEQSVNSNAE